MQYLKDDIRKNIMEAALSEFGKMGYKGASIRSICQEAGTSVGNFYKYFAGKDDIFESLIGPVYRNLMGYTEQFNQVEFNENTEGIFYRMTEKIMGIFEKNSEALTILFNKSEGSRYETCKETFVAFITGIATQTMNYRLSLQEKRLKDNFLIYLVSCNLVESIGIILREKEDGREVRELILDMIQILFGPKAGEGSQFFQHFEARDMSDLESNKYIENTAGVSEQ